MKWIIAASITLIMVSLVLRLWHYIDDRSVASTWNSLSSTAKVNPGLFGPKHLEGLPSAAQRFFEMAIQSGTPLYTIAEITMRGEFSLGDKHAPKYQPMKACQLLAPPLGFVWNVKAGAGLMRMSGSDAAYPGGSWTRFWLFGIIPVARVGGNDDHALSSFGRTMGEAIFWSPASLLPSDNVIWEEIDSNNARVLVQHKKFIQAFDIKVGTNGHLEQVRFERWSDVNAEKTYRFQPFGGYLSDFKEFDGFILPSTVEAGNHFGSDDYYPFFKASVEAVRFIKDPTDESTCVLKD